MSVKFDVPTDEEMKRAEADLEEKHSGKRTRSIKKVEAIVDAVHLDDVVVKGKSTSVLVYGIKGLK